MKVWTVVVEAGRGVSKTPSHIFHINSSSAHTAGWNGVKEFLGIWKEEVFDYMKILIRERTNDERKKVQSPKQTIPTMDRVRR